MRDPNGCNRNLRPSRRGLRPLLRMSRLLMALRKILILRSAPFETPPAAAPQGKLARLEGRTVQLQRANLGVLT